LGKSNKLFSWPGNVFILKHFRELNYQGKIVQIALRFSPVENPKEFDPQPDGYGFGHLPLACVNFLAVETKTGKKLTGN